MFNINTSNIGMLLLAIYLILLGITEIFSIGMPVIILGILALAAGVCLLLGK